MMACVHTYRDHSQTWTQHKDAWAVVDALWRQDYRIPDTGICTVSVQVFVSDRDLGHALRIVGVSLSTIKL